MNAELMAAVPDCSTVPSATVERVPYKEYQCLVCGFCYAEAAGMSGDGIPSGTIWEQVPARWLCPLCGAAKKDFKVIHEKP